MSAGTCRIKGPAVRDRRYKKAKLTHYQLHV